MDAGAEQTPKKKSRSGRVLAVLLVLVVAGAGIYLFLTLNQNTFYAGVSVDGIDLDDMTYQQAVDAVTAQHQPELDAINIGLTYGDKTWTYGAEDIHAMFNAEEVLTQAWAVGREGSIVQRFQDINAAKTQPVSYSTSLTYDAAALRGDLTDIASEIDKEPVDATIEFHQGEDPMFTFTPEEAGRQLLVDDTINEIMQRVGDKEYGSMELPVEDLSPRYTQDEMKTWTTQISSFRTLLHGSEDRTYNIQLSSSAYDGLRLDPGQTFSLNDTTGPRDKAHGYRDADVIKEGKKLEPEPGGGNCQTATTLYGAAIRADLTIVERYPHSFPSTYTEVGQDATVNYPYADIKVKNDKDTPVFVDRYFDGDWICVDIYGKVPTEYDRINVETVILEQRPTPDPTMVADSTLAVGTHEEEYKSRPYIKCETYRVYYKDGAELKRVFEAKSVYNQVVGLTRVGTRMPDGTVVSLEQALNPLTVPTPSPSPGY